MMCWMCRPTSNSIVLCNLHALCFNKEKWKHKDDVIRSGPMRKSFSCHVLFEQKQAFLLYCYMSMFFHFVRISVFNTFSGAGDSPMHAQLEITIEWTQRGAGNFIWKIISKLLKFIGELQLDTLHPIQLNNNEIVDAVRLRQSGFFRVFIERISNTFSCTQHIWKTHANPSICSFVLSTHHCGWRSILWPVLFDATNSIHFRFFSVQTKARLGVCRNRDPVIPYLLKEIEWYSIT